MRHFDKLSVNRNATPISEADDEWSVATEDDKDYGSWEHKKSMPGGTERFLKGEIASAGSIDFIKGG